MTARIRVLIVDDHPIVRSGLSSVLSSQADFDVVGEAANGEEAVRLADALAPDVVLMDLRMPVRDGVSSTEEIVRTRPATRVVVLTTYATDGDILRAVEVGAVGYLLKDAPHDELFRALRAVMRGERYLGSAVAERLMARWSRPASASLTDREREVLTHVARGASNKNIAAQLGISEPTVKAHLVHIFEKLDVENRTAAVRVATERGDLDRVRPSSP